MTNLISLLSNTWTYIGLGASGFALFGVLAYVLGFGAAVQLLFKILNDLYDSLKSALGYLKLGASNALDSVSGFFFIGALLIGLHIYGEVTKMAAVKQCTNDYIELADKYKALQKKVKRVKPHPDVKVKKVPTLDLKWPWQ